jgi:hypothetical protein
MAVWSGITNVFRGGAVESGRYATGTLRSHRANLPVVKRNATFVAALLSLGLAIGACVSAFRLIDAVLLRPLPVSERGRLSTLVRGKATAFESTSYPRFRPMRATAIDEAELIAISYTDQTDLTYETGKETEKASGWMFRSFRLLPALARLLAESDDPKPRANPIAVSCDYWTPSAANGHSSGNTAKD